MPERLEPKRPSQALRGAALASRRAIALAASLSALGAVVSLARTGAAEEVSQTVRGVLVDRRYRFCHEDDYPLAPDEHEWCPIVGETSSACPSLPKACKLPPVERMASVHRGFQRRTPHRVRPGEEPAARPDQDDSRQRPPDCQMPDLSSLSDAARVVLFGMLAATVALVARLLYKNLVRTRAAAEPEVQPPDEAPEEHAPVPRGPVETDVERLLSRARAEAARGDYAHAVDHAYAALLRRLDGDGLIEIHTSRTNGDYVRALGERAELRSVVRGIVRDVEDVQFGSTPPSDAVFRSVLERVLPIASRAAAFMVLLLGLGAVLSCGDGEESGYGDTSPSGMLALIDVMGKHGVKLRRRAEPLEKLDQQEAILVLPDASLDEATWKHVLSWVEEKGGTLIVAGATTMPAEVEQRIAGDSETATTLEIPGSLRWVGHPRVSLPPGRRILPAMSPDGGSPPDAAVWGNAVLRRGESVVVTERELGDGHIVVVADERLFTNIALTAADDAAFVLSLLFRSAFVPDRVVELCDAWTGAGAKTPLDSLHQAKLTPFLVQLFVLMALLFLWKGRAFAALRDPPAEARRAFVDHARALGLAYQRARASRHVTGLYAVWALERLRERVHRSGRQGLIPLAEAIAARTGRPEADVMRVLVEAVGARDEAAPPSSFRPPSLRRPAGKPGDTAGSDLELMRELMSFLAATGSSRRARRGEAPATPEGPRAPHETPEPRP
jgi:hypothetical protein